MQESREHYSVIQRKSDPPGLEKRTRNKGSERRRNNSTYLFFKKKGVVQSVEEQEPARHS